jgi:hypothetical protein
VQVLEVDVRGYFFQKCRQRGVNPTLVSPAAK